MSVSQIPIYQADAAAGTTSVRYLALGENYVLNGVKLINNGAIAAHAANYATVTIYGNNGSTAAFSWSTDSAKEGALSDGVAVNMSDKASGLTRYSAGTAIKMAITKDGSGQSLDCSVILEFAPARTY